MWSKLVCRSERVKQPRRTSIRASRWTNYRWNTEYCESISRLRVFISMTSIRTVGMGLPQTAWVKVNHLRTGVGQFHSFRHKCGLTPSPNCECGAAELTADYVLRTRPTHWTSHEARALTVLNDEI